MMVALFRKPRKWSYFEMHNNQIECQNLGLFGLLLVHNRPTQALLAENSRSNVNSCSRRCC